MSAHIIQLSEYRKKGIPETSAGIPLKDPLVLKSRTPMYVLYTLFVDGIERRAYTWLCAYSFDEAREMVKEQYPSFSLRIDDVGYASDAY
jgi:hypothetical protein